MHGGIWRCKEVHVGAWRCMEVHEGAQRGAWRCMLLAEYGIVQCQRTRSVQKNAILDGCSTVDSKLDYDGIGLYLMVFDGIAWYSMVFCY